jgi:dienelactone hydrolase
MDHSAALARYARFDFDHGRWRRTVFRRGAGPAVIIMHEIPGLHPQVIAFADDVAQAGMTVFLPSLFGAPGKPASTGYALGEMALNVCIRREFNVWANDRSSPIVDWLRALARQAHAECGGPGVGALGMCFTGGFALAMMTEPAVVAPVLSQPSLPLGPGAQAKIDASPEEIACVKRRMTDEDLSMIGLRFQSDRLVPDARFARLRAEFGDRFEAVELADADGRAGGGMAPHAVLTLHLDDRPGSGTRRAKDRVIEFFRQRLGVTA